MTLNPEVTVAITDIGAKVRSAYETNKDNIEVTAYLEDGSTKILGSDEFEVSYNPTTKVITNITETITTNTAERKNAVGYYDDGVVKVEITKNNTKKNWATGETFKHNVQELVTTYEDGSTRTWTKEDNLFWHFGLHTQDGKLLENAEWQRTVWVPYLGTNGTSALIGEIEVSTTFTFNVWDVESHRIMFGAVQTQPTKTEYIGDEKPDLSGLVVRVNYAVPLEIANYVIEYNDKTKADFGLKIKDKEQVGDDVKMTYTIVYKGFSFAQDFVAYVKDTNLEQVPKTNA